MRYVGLTIRENRIGTHDYGTYTCHAFSEQIEITKTVQLKKPGKYLFLYLYGNEGYFCFKAQCCLSDTESANVNRL